MDARQYYFLGTGSWFFSHGIQTVIFAWLVTIVLREPAEMVGIAQMTFLAPAMVLMLIGGSLADQYGGRPVAIGGQAVAALSVFALALCIAVDRFTYSSLLLFAAAMGCAQALVTPARDGLLALVAGGRIQRRVVQASLIQFAVQMLGFLAASYADRTGAVAILLLQCLALILGIVAFHRLTVPPIARALGGGISFATTFASIGIGLQTVKSSRPMLMVVALNCAMGMFFMGSYLVTVPLLVRDLYSGTSAQLAWVNTANAVGLVLTILVLLRFGDVHRQGRALIIAHGAGAIALGSASLGMGFPALVASVFFWGMCGGVGMTMSRTIMQELAPSDQRARIMAFFSFSFMGAGPVGALGNGYMASWLGAPTALMLSSGAMFVVVTIVATCSNLWQLDTDPRKI